MALRQILTEPNKILRQKSIKVEIVDENIQTCKEGNQRRTDING